jgi:hypothetical protein
LVAEHNPTSNNPQHYLVKPRRDVPLSEYQQALADTRDDWSLVRPEDGA